MEIKSIKVREKITRRMLVFKFVLALNSLLIEAEKWEGREAEVNQSDATDTLSDENEESSNSPMFVFFCVEAQNIETNLLSYFFVYLNIFHISFRVP